MRRLVNNMLSDIDHRRTTWFDRLTFGNIFLIWIAVIFLFGLLYHFAGQGRALIYAHDDIAVESFLDQIYFSFVTATTTGFGDITPVGTFKFVAAFEVVISLLLLAFVTSKLVMIKQDIILEEIYEISFKERMNRLRSNLLLFRQHLERLIAKVETHTVTSREVNSLSISIVHFEETLHEVVTLFPAKKQSFTKRIDPVDRELLINSVVLSFEKLEETLRMLNSTQHEWKHPAMLKHLNSCLGHNKALFRELTQQLGNDPLSDLSSRNVKAMDKLRACMASGVLKR
jgi:hypothetical protein